MKLTKEMREEVIASCVASRFAKRESAYMKARSVLADALYDLSFGYDEKAAKKLPAIWIGKMHDVEIACEGFESRWRSDPDDQRPNTKLKLSKARLMPYSITDQFKVVAGHPLYSDACALVELYKLDKKDRETLEHELRTLLYAVTTLEKLKTTWPEGAKFFPVEVKKTLLPVPYSLTLSINKLMGL